MITAITGGKVITVTGQTYEKATVLTEDGKIKAIGTDLTIPEGAQVIDASGCWVTPGLIDCHTHICNFNEPGTLPGMYDGNEMSGPIQAQVRAMDAVYPDDYLFHPGLWQRDRWYRHLTQTARPYSTRNGNQRQRADEICLWRKSKTQLWKP